MLGITEELYVSYILAYLGITNLIHKKGQYLSTMAKGIYFLRSDAKSNTAFIETWQTRLFMVSSATHVLTAILLLFFISGITVHMLHFRYRRALQLTRRPGTLATAIAYTADSNLRNNLRSIVPEGRFNEYLTENHFKLDMKTARIMMEETDYDTDMQAISSARPQYIERGELVTKYQEDDLTARRIVMEESGCNVGLKEISPLNAQYIGRGESLTAYQEFEMAPIVSTFYFILTTHSVA
ncbi:hypothetical protein M422DRAFT_177064 [Sphaerobolus stellatus SS14]|uniref:Uncharacterized protein n=1 Tax=Sphaerobolus stellatus (strain SS14) TaxID=990650 RepID=A0A0C9UT96_SPHS4|nr:hypothetical protein M422DRAFT_177064 [Sphaerobolus stellatus SS14]